MQIFPYSEEWMSLNVCLWILYGNIAWYIFKWHKKIPTNKKAEYSNAIHI